ncbi:hypothetical protein N7488_012019 [Penicillium malachiteum]|nr:hypothetical protein N7488_012019 [Penicillium malachiteum]
MRRLLLFLALSALLLILFLKARSFQSSLNPIPVGLNHKVKPDSGASKDPFQPVYLTGCTDTTPNHYAPCLAQTLPHAVSGEELLYPGFSISPQIFASSRPQDAGKWWNTTWLMWGRACKLDTRLRYPEKHGQVYVFENVTLSPATPFDTWTMDSCMSSFAPTSYASPSSDPPTHDSVLLANVPDSWSLQHFLDRAMRVFAQSRDYRPGHIVTGRESDKSIRELWSSLGYPPDHVLHRDTMINEDVLLKEIQTVLNHRGNNEKLEMFTHNDFADMKALIRYLQQNVKAVIGPHGSALHNHLWTAPDTLVMEFQPTSRPDLTFYESAKMRDHPYVVLMEDPVDEKHNMRVDVPAVVQILEEKLGRELEVGDKVKLGLNSFFLYANNVVTAYYLAIYFQDVLGKTPTLSGVYTLPGILGQVICGISAGYAVTRLGYYLPWSIIGTTLAAIGSGLISTFTENTNTGTWIGYQIITGVGRGLSSQMPLVAVQKNVPVSQIAVSMAFLKFCQSFGGSLLLSFADTAFGIGLDHALPKYAPGVSAATVSSAGVSGIRTMIPQGKVEGVIMSYVAAIQGFNMEKQGTTKAHRFLKFGRKADKELKKAGAQQREATSLTPKSGHNTDGQSTTEKKKVLADHTVEASQQLTSTDHEPARIQATQNITFWGKAYSEIINDKDKDIQELVKAYGILLRDNPDEEHDLENEAAQTQAKSADSELSADGDELLLGSFSKVDEDIMTKDHVGDEAHMRNFATVRLEEMQSKEWKVTTIVQIVEKFSGFLGNVAALDTSQHAGLAWEGVCVLLPLITNDTKERQLAIDGIELMARITARYTMVDRDYTSGSIKRDPPFEKALVSLLYHQMAIKLPKRWTFISLKAVEKETLRLPVPLDFEQASKLLIEVINSRDETTLILDGLDEFPSFVSLLHNLRTIDRKAKNLKILFSSQYVVPVDRYFPSAVTAVAGSKASFPDMRMFVEGELRRFQVQRQNLIDEALAADIIETLPEKAEGTFKWAELSLKAVLDPDSEIDAKEINANWQSIKST